jgi:hypothetical protein
MPAGTDLCQVEMAIHIIVRLRMHVYLISCDGPLILYILYFPWL